MFSAKRAASYFDVVADPFAQLTDRATICLFLRGDIGEATKTVAMTWIADGLTTGRGRAQYVDEDRWLLDDEGRHSVAKGFCVPADVSFGMSPGASPGEGTRHTR